MGNVNFVRCADPTPHDGHPLTDWQGEVTVHCLGIPKTANQLLPSQPAMPPSVPTLTAEQVEGLRRSMDGMVRAVQAFSDSFRDNLRDLHPTLGRVASALERIAKQRG